MPPKKFLSPPNWAKQQENVLGYTYKVKLDATAVEHLTYPQPKGTKFPSVYYYDGHRTVWHKIPANIGWEGLNRQWLFFGNVLEAWLDQHYWKNPQDKENGGKLIKDDDDRKAFAKELRGKVVTASTEMLAAKRHAGVYTPASSSSATSAASSSATRHICTSYSDDELTLSGPQKDGEDNLKGEARLVEIYYDEGDLFDHPARNRFWWAGDGSLKQSLHKLAIQGARF